MSTLEGKTFFFCVKELTVDPEAQKKRFKGETWYPPTLKAAFKEKRPQWFKWDAGKVETVVGTLSVGAEYGAATVFTQNPEGCLVAVKFDTTKEDVSPDDHTDWPRLHFKHETKDSKALSYVDPYEGKRTLAAPGSSIWMPQLVPQIFNWTPGNGNGLKPAVSGGLIGNLPVLLALAAFASPPSMVKNVMCSCVRPNAWSKGSGFQCGRGISEWLLERSTCLRAPRNC